MSKHILIVEDDPVSLRFISGFLSKEGYQVREAKDGAEAIELINNSRFDLVLSGVRMPQLDGVALAKYILSRTPSIPMIMMTAIPSELTAIQGYGVSYLSKPLLLDKLRSNVQRALTQG